MPKINIESKTFFFLLASILCIHSLSADRGDGFAGGLVGGLTGGMVAGAISNSGRNRSDRDIEQIKERQRDKEIEELRREKNKETLEEMKQAINSERNSKDQFVLYLLFFVVFCLVIALGFLGFIVLRR